MNWITVTTNGKRREINLDQILYIEEVNGLLTLFFTDNNALTLPKPEGFVYPSDKNKKVTK